MSAVVLALLALFLVACTDDSPRPSTTPAPPSPTAAATPTTTPSPTPTVTPPQGGSSEPLPAMQDEDGDWALANGGYANRRARASDLTEENAADLAIAWQVPILTRAAYGAAAGAPVVAGGVVYVQSLGGDVMAIDLETGERLWLYSAGVQTSGPAGPAVADGRVFVANGGAELVALDAASGDVLWTAEVEKDGYQPMVVEGRVIVGTGNHAHVAGNSGFVHSYDAETGELQWSFQVVAEGFWGNPNLNSGGGIWYQPAADLGRGLLYIGTGNAGPYPGTRDYPNAGSRPGPNLYTSALVALDIETGEVVWYDQVVPRGLFDHDFQLPPMLLRTQVAGAERDIIIGAGKVGRVLAWDRDTREVLWDVPVGRHENDDLQEIPLGQAVLVYPGIFGGVETPMALAEGRVFVPVVNLGTVHTATGHGAADGSSALLNANDHTNLWSGTGELVALEVATGEVAWQVELPSPIFGGATVMGALVFTATWDGIIYGFSRTTGEELWRYDAGGAINAWPAVQDGTLLWPIGLGGSPRLIAFRLP